MKCPYGCKIRKRSTYTGYSYQEDAKLSYLKFYTISKSGKTLYEYLYCPKCQRVFKKGHRIHSLKKPEEVAKVVSAIPMG